MKRAESIGDENVRDIGKREREREKERNDTNREARRQGGGGERDIKKYDSALKSVLHSAYRTPLDRYEFKWFHPTCRLPTVHKWRFLAMKICPIHHLQQKGSKLSNL